LYDEHVASVFGYAWRCSGRRDLAENLTQESFLALHRSLDEVEDSRLPGWLFTVVKNLSIDYWRRASRDFALPEQPPAGAVQPGGRPLEDLIARAQDLKPAHRVCLTLRYVHGMDSHEIAQHTGMTEEQITRALGFALEGLRHVIES
jgi:RNA polymerase sigma-70 factor (ECF subfamily)